MKFIILFLSFFISVLVKAQSIKILCFDLKKGTVDTLTMPDYDTTQINEETNYYVGSYDDLICTLNESIPDENVYENSQFTHKVRAALDYDINQYPIRTSIKLFRMENDTLKQLCSGSLISRYHVFTACHCVASMINDSLLFDSLLVCPAFDNGEINKNFGSSWVKKVYIFENWDIKITDFAILELEEPLGEKTGWISMGFNSNDSLLTESNLYKFSYPGKTSLDVDSTEYNGDTLYYSFGQIDRINTNFLMFNNSIGIPGESGSSFIKILNNEQYTTYGVHTYPTIISRLTNWKYYGLKSIIENYTYPYYLTNNDSASYVVFPNPVTDKINLVAYNDKIIANAQLFDINGKMLLSENINSYETVLDVSSIQNGFYVLSLKIDNQNYIQKIIKTNY